MNSNILRLACIFSLGAFSSCALGPNYQRPKVDVPTSFRGQIDAEMKSIASLPWWKVFKDPTLQQLIEEALVQNHDLRIAITRIEQARARTTQAKAGFFPQIGYSMEAERVQQPGSRLPAQTTPPSHLSVNGVDISIPGTHTPEREVPGARNNRFATNGLLSWELDLWGRIRRSNEAALANLLATEEARRGITQTLVADVASTYFQLRGYDEELAISRETSASFRKTLELFSKQQEGGVASDLEVTRAKASLAGAMAAIPRLERLITQTENRLCLLLGRNPSPIKRGRSLSAQHLPPKVPAGIPGELLERRPDLRQAEQRLRAANAEVGIAITHFLPRIDLTAGAGVVSPALSQFGNGNGNIWNIAGSISGPIFQGGRLVGIYREKESRWRETVLDYERTALNAFSEVANALVSRQKLEEVRAAQRREVSALQQSVKLSLDRYTIGISTYYEVLEAQQQLFPAQLNLVSTQVAQLISVVDLYRALGGGW